MKHISRVALAWLAAFLLGVTEAPRSCARDTNTSLSGSGSVDTVSVFDEEQQSLAQDWLALAASGTSTVEVNAWVNQNALRFQGQRQRANLAAALSALQPIDPGRSAAIPGNVTGVTRDFLVAQAALISLRAQIHNQLLQGLPLNVTPDEVKAVRKQEEQIFQQQHAAELQQQASRIQALAAAPTSQSISAIPGTTIPSGATPQLRSYLLTRDAIMRDWIKLRNQFATADPATRRGAIEQWRRQNMSRLQQLRAATSALSATGAAQAERNP